MDSNKKKLLFRASHRGIREMDIILGRYAAMYLPEMRDADVTVFARILQLDDQPFFQALTEDTLKPQHFSALYALPPHGRSMELMLRDIWLWMREYPYCGEDSHGDK